ncbi:Fc fragment of IgE, low affinity II, receptor for (CD23) [Chamberlinius hualienensis]
MSHFLLNLVLYKLYKLFLHLIIYFPSRNSAEYYSKSKMFFILFVSSVLLVTFKESAVAEIKETPFQLKINGENIELKRPENSWLKMLLLFSQNEQKTNCDTSDNVKYPTIESSTTSTEIPIDFIELGSKLYYFSYDIVLNWHESFNFCKHIGAKLAYPLNDEESKHILSRLTLFTGWWLGAQRNSEENWVWAHDNSTVQFTNWAKGQPRNGDYGDCMTWLTFNNKWYNAPCTYKYTFVCQL